MRFSVGMIDQSLQSMITVVIAVGGVVVGVVVVGVVVGVVSCSVDAGCGEAAVVATSTNDWTSSSPLISQTQPLGAPDELTTIAWVSSSHVSH